MKKILVVEDEAITAMDLEDLLGDLNYDVIATADNSKDALVLAKEKPDIILMDINIKGDIDGIKTVSEIKKSYDPVVIFLTSYSDEETVTRAKLVNPDNYLLKPYNQTELKIALELGISNKEAKLNNLNSNKLLVKDNNFEINRPKTEITYKRTIEQFLSGIEVFENINEKDLSDLAKEAYYRECKSKEILVNQNEPEFSALIPVSTSLSLTKYTSGGKEIITDILEPGNPYLLILSIFHSNNGFSVQAGEAGIVMQISKSQIAELLIKNPNLYEEFNKIMIEELQKSKDFLSMMAYENVEKRIAFILVKLCQNLARYSFSSNEYTINITRQQLASLVGTTQETAIRQTRKLEDEGILSLINAGEIIITNIDRLEEIANQ